MIIWLTHFILVPSSLIASITISQWTAISAEYT
ncbi:uncharacterized protein METZ01_LOCUS487843, partial [marine metagenome]